MDSGFLGRVYARPQRSAAGGLWAGPVGLRRGRRRALRPGVGVVLGGCALALLAVLGLIVLVQAAGGGSHAVAGVGPPAWVLREQRLARGQAARRERWLQSPAARRQRLDSQMAFHDLPASAASRLLRRDFAGSLAGVSANPAASIARQGRIVRYLGNNRVLVRTARGLQEKISSVPLRVAGPGGAKRPVDLGLVAHGGAFVPASPLAAVSIARGSAGGVTVGPDGLGIAFRGADVSGRALDGQSVFFGAVARDTDADVAPTLDGAEFFAALRSRLSPEELRYRLSLPAGAVLRAAAGGAVVLRAGVVLARVPAPLARDAQGVTVPVRMSVMGDELLLDVRHSSSDIAYPVLVDPALITVTDSSEGWTFAEYGEDMTGSVGSGISVAADTSANYGYTKTGRFEYIKALERPVASKVEFQGLSFSASSTNEKGEPVEAVSWEALVCDHGYGGKSASPPPATLVIRTGEHCTEKEFSIEFTLVVEPSAFAATGTFSASAVVLTTEWQRDEDYQAEEYGPGSEGQPFKEHCTVSDPVNCATGNLTESQTDLMVGGRGPVLGMTRSYNSQFAAGESEHGVFGFGWTGSYSAHIALAKSCETCSETATVYQDNGSVALFEKSGEQWEPVSPLLQATLHKEGTEYVYTLPNQTKLTFESAGRLTSETDRDGNTLTMNRNSEGRLESVSDSAGRKLTLAYNSSGEVESVTDPMGHTVKYTYEGGNLVSVTQPGETAIRWKFKYNSSHELTEMTDGRGDITTTEYNGLHQVTGQTDPLKRKHSWKYGTISEGTYTEITEPNESVTREEFNEQGLPTSVTHAYGSTLAATTTYEYDGYDNLVAVTNPDKHTTKYGYNASGDRTSETDPDGDETKWGYDSTHDVTSITTPDGETTTIKREGHGNPEVIERPAPGSKTQITKYKYDSKGDLESITNPVEHTWQYEYDSYGDRTAEVDPEGNKRTWAYNEDSQEISTTSPRGNATTGEAARFTTTIERNAEGRVLAGTEPLSEALYNFHFGSAGSGEGELEVPIGLAVDSSGNVWVADNYNNRIEKFSSSGTFLAAYSSLGSGSTALKGPRSVTIDSKGDVWVSDGGNHRIVELSSSGILIRAFGYGVANGKAEPETCTSNCEAGIEGSGSGQFQGPQATAIDAKGDVWVVETGGDRVQEFNEKGEYLNKFGSEGTGADEFEAPTDIAISEGDIYVADNTNNRIDELSSTGSFVQAFGYGVANGEAKPETCTTTCEAGIAGSANGQFNGPARLAANPTNGEIYVADHSNARIEVFNTSGAFLSKFGSAGKGEGQLENLKGVTVNTTGDVYIAEAGSDRVQEWTAPAPRVTKYTYDAAGNLETATDPNSNKTKYTYDADNELTKIEEPNKTVTETEYDSAGQVTSQTDGNKHTTKYFRNLREEVTEVVDPLGHKTTKEYDLAGNLTRVTNPAKQTATYTYDSANRLTEVKYSDGKTPTVKYEYNKDGDRTVMTDGTGTSKYTYDQLDRLTETENGHKEKIKYEYDLANEQIKITYPNEKSITRAYDKNGRLETVTDWLGDVTKFTYDPDSNLASTVFPSASTDEDKYAYNEADQISEVKMLKGTETLASLIYTRDGDEQVKTTTGKGLPGEEKTGDEYDTNDRLTKGGTSAYEYDAANNPTKIASGSYKYNAADELETGPSLTYTYNELDERTKTTPSSGPATTYGYDEAGNLITVERPKEGEIPKIEDAYAYNGEGLRASQTISGITSYLAWDMVEELPLILSDGTNSYIYGPGGLPVEQINSGGTVTYLHHDQAGSTRLLTGSTGTVTGKCTYSAYGTPTCEGTTTTPLGYDAQYTSVDTGLIYMRARVYDPATAQFLSVDPLKAITDEPYSYAGDNPLNRSDPTGLLFGIGLPSLEEIGEGVAGWGDTITFGGTEWVREQLGDNNIDACSGAYQGGGIAGLVTGVLIPGEDDAEVAEGVEAESEFGSTPEGRPFTEHYGLERGPERNIPGSVVDQTINENPGVPGRNGTTIHYDPGNDVTVVTGDNGAIVSARRGPP